MLTKRYRRERVRRRRMILFWGGFPLLVLIGLAFIFLGHSRIGWIPYFIGLICVNFIPLVMPDKFRHWVEAEDIPKANEPNIRFIDDAEDYWWG